MEDKEKLISSHMSYKEYQEKNNKPQNDGIAIFVSAFFILLLLFLGIAKQMSPDVDVAIGDNDNITSESIGIDKGNVDERLKLLQLEDNSKDTMFVSELEEKVVIPEDKTENKNNNEEEEIKLKVRDQGATPKPETTASNEPKIPLQTLEQSKGTPVKVVVGYYATREQAEVAKEIISESGMNITPFVKAIGGGYTVQVGSFATREKAQSITDNLLRNNYPAKIIME